MNARQAVTTFMPAVVAAAIWLPAAVWVMRRVAGAPTYTSDPLWYWSSFGVGTVLACAVRWAAEKRSAAPLSKESS